MCLPTFSLSACFPYSIINSFINIHFVSLRSSIQSINPFVTIFPSIQFFSLFVNIFHSILFINPPVNIFPSISLLIRLSIFKLSVHFPPFSLSIISKERSNSFAPQYKISNAGGSAVYQCKYECILVVTISLTSVSHAGWRAQRNCELVTWTKLQFIT